MFEMNEALRESMADVSHKQTQTHKIIIIVITVWLDSQANCSVFFSMNFAIGANQNGKKPQ